MARAEANRGVDEAQRAAGDTTQREARLWTTRSLLGWMTEAFTRAGLDSPRLMAEMLLARVIGGQRLDLYTSPDRPASERERETLRGLVARALQHEPVQYLVGEGWFFSLAFTVDRRVLIPRPSTETIVEAVMQDARPRLGDAGEAGGRALWIADICAGSGAIGVALLKNLPGARCVASDVSAEALEVAETNARRHGVMGRMTLLRGDLLEPVREWMKSPVASAPGSEGNGMRAPVARAPGSEGEAEGRATAAESSGNFAGFDYVCANPPYIPDEEWGEVGLNVRGQEPEIALRGGADGMKYAAPLLQGAPALLKAGGMLLVETAASRAEQAAETARADARLTDVRVLEDSDGLPRVVAAKKK